MFICYVSDEDIIIIKNVKSPRVDNISSTTLKQRLSKNNRNVNCYYKLMFFPKEVVIPIYETNLTLFCINYRPIYLLSVFPKLIEKKQWKKLNWFFNEEQSFYLNPSLGVRDMSTETTWLFYEQG